MFQGSLLRLLSFFPHSLGHWFCWRHFPITWAVFIKFRFLERLILLKRLHSFVCLFNIVLTPELPLALPFPLTPVYFQLPVPFLSVCPTHISNLTCQKLTRIFRRACSFCRDLREHNGKTILSLEKG